MLLHIAKVTESSVDLLCCGGHAICERHCGATEPGLCQPLNERLSGDSVAKRVKLMALQPGDLLDVFKTDTSPTWKGRETSITPPNTIFTTRLGDCR